MNRSNPFRFDLRNGIRFIAKKISGFAASCVACLF